MGEVETVDKRQGLEQGPEGGSEVPGRVEVEAVEAVEAGSLRISATTCSRCRRNAESVAADTSSTTVMVPCSAAVGGR